MSLKIAASLLVALALGISLAACGPGYGAKAANSDACKKWASDYSNMTTEADKISESDWFSGSGAKILDKLANQDSATADLAQDELLIGLLRELSSTERIWASDLSNGTESVTPPITQVDIYERCYELGIQTEPKEGDGSFAAYYIDVLPGNTLTPQQKLSHENKKEIESGAFEAVQRAYFDCFPAVAADLTIINFLKRRSSVEYGVIAQSFTANTLDPRRGIVTIYAGRHELNFDTKLGLDGEYRINTTDTLTQKALTASKCTKHN